MRRSCLVNRQTRYVNYQKVTSQRLAAALPQGTRTAGNGPELCIVVLWDSSSTYWPQCMGLLHINSFVLFVQPGCSSVPLTALPLIYFYSCAPSAATTTAPTWEDRSGPMVKAQAVGSILWRPRQNKCLYNQQEHVMRGPQPQHEADFCYFCMF